MDYTELLSYYPMIHRDKLIYRYGTDGIRIGTDDTDVVQLNTTSEDIFSILKLMDGNHSVDDLLSMNTKLNIYDISAIVVKLFKVHALSILTQKLDSLTTGDRFKSDITYYYSEGIDGFEILNTLANLKITIFGAGGGGSLIALQLANLGVGNIHIVDPDAISESNLNRQILFSAKDIGKLKVDAVKKYLNDRNPKINVTTSTRRIERVTDAVKELSDADWVFCCIDEPPYIAQRTVNRACFSRKIPSLYGFTSRDSAKLMVVYPGKTGCVDCLLTNRDNLQFRKLIASFQNASFLPITPIIVPNMMLETAWITRRWLDELTEKESCVNTLLRFDFNTLKEEKFISFDRENECPTCGKECSSSKLWDIIQIKD